MTADLNNLKKHIFYELLNLAGRVFIHVRYSEEVVIGKRGFLPEEREKGIILVLNSRMNFTWDSYGISAKLVFSAAPEDCFIPADEILSIFSPELHAQFSVTPQENQDRKVMAGLGKSSKKERPDKVIKVDFHRKKSRGKK